MKLIKDDFHDKEDNDEFIQDIEFINQLSNINLKHSTFMHSLSHEAGANLLKFLQRSKVSCGGSKQLRMDW